METLFLCFVRCPLISERNLKSHLKLSNIYLLVEFEHIYEQSAIHISGVQR